MLEIKLIDKHRANLGVDCGITARCNLYVSRVGDPDVYPAYSNVGGLQNLHAIDEPAKPHLFVGLNAEHEYIPAKELREFNLTKNLCGLEPYYRDDRAGTYVEFHESYRYADCEQPGLHLELLFQRPIRNFPANVVYPCADSDRESNDNKAIFATDYV